MAGSRQTEDDNFSGNMELSCGNSCIHNVLWLKVMLEARLLYDTEVH